VCYKVLEPHLVSDIKRATKLILCQNCGSIFVWTDKA
jgi:predicted  nucleic acid-binding Zn-ribbon protein